MKQLALKFGTSLDNDDFENAKETLSSDCKYAIGDNIITGADAIVDSYKQNMLQAREKLDLVEWGKSKVENISNSQYMIRFTDYLTHKGIKHTHYCQQKITIQSGRIVEIEHIADAKETEALIQFYKKAGVRY